MTSTTIRYNVLWAKRIEGDAALVARILALPQNAPITLVIDGTPIHFVKMRDGADGRPTPGLHPAEADATRFRDTMRQHVGRVRVTMAEDPFLASLTALLWEWGSAEDAKAYDRP